MSAIYFSRHGESQTNIGVPTVLHDGARLTEQGIEQAKRVAAYLKSHTPLDLIVTSYYERSKETATFTQSLFPDVPTEEWMVQEFTYLASLHHEYSTSEDRKPLVEAYWSQQDPEFVDGPGSESFAALMKRVYSLIEQLKYMPYESIVIFSHEQFITAFLWLIERNPTRLTGELMRDFRNYLLTHPILNGEIIRAQFRQKQLTWHFKHITEHLQQPVDTRLEWEWAQEHSLALPGGRYTIV